MVNLGEKNEYYSISWSIGRKRSYTDRSGQGIGDMDWRERGSGAMRVYLMGPRILAKNSYIWCYDTSYTDIMGNRYNRSLSKGTYYLKVVKENAATSGMYVVSWR